jgi:hypothetical protein
MVFFSSPHGTNSRISADDSHPPDLMEIFGGCLFDSLAPQL